MADNSKIEWTDATWPIVQGCDPVSQGCVRCYAIKELWRMMHHPNPRISGPLQGLVEGYTNRDGERILRFTGKVALREDRLDWPLHWREPRMIFVPSHGDLFHQDVPDEFIDKVFQTMGECDDLARGHRFQILTKRSQRMRDYMGLDRAHKAWNGPRIATEAWPPHNVWLGVSAERQQEADERIPHLLQTPAAVRFVSAEPLLGPINLEALMYGTGVNGNPDMTIRLEGPIRARLDWVIVGGESGAEARPMHPQWARDIRDQCEAASVAFFFKQWGEFAPTPALEPATHAIFKSGQCYRAGHVMGAMDTPAAVLEAVNRELGFYTRISRYGKKSAGRLLDCKLHNDFPKAAP